MGITRPAICAYENLIDAGLLDLRNATVFELGSQDIHFEDQPLFEQLLRKSDRPAHLASKFHNNMSARDFHGAFGGTYYCIDLDERAETIPWDLNVVQCPDEFRHRSDLTTNHGTTEHLFGQANAFKLMHDLTKVGGIIFHTLPCTGQNDHGFFSYSPIVFQYLAHYNNYELVQLAVTDFHATTFFDNYERFTTLPSWTYVMVALKKLSDQEFVPPAQIYLNKPADSQT